MTTEDRSNFETAEFDRIQITDKILYKDNKAYILHDQNDNQKLHDILPVYEIFEYEYYYGGILQGPTRVHGTKNIMIVTMKCNDFELPQPYVTEPE